MTVKSWMKGILERCNYITWDRYVMYQAGDDFCTVYGWIKREDEYKDFAVIEFNLTKKEIGFVITSSAKYSEQFNKDTDGLEIEHNHCKRIEDDFPDLKNCVRLNGSNGL